MLSLDNYENVSGRKYLIHTVQVLKLRAVSDV